MQAQNKNIVDEIMIPSNFQSKLIFYFIIISTILQTCFTKIIATTEQSKINITSKIKSSPKSSPDPSQHEKMDINLSNEEGELKRAIIVFGSITILTCIYFYFKLKKVADSKMEAQYQSLTDDDDADKHCQDKVDRLSNLEIEMQ